MKPLSIKTEFTFSINRDFINIITDSCNGGLFENVEVKYGNKKGSSVLRNCHVVYTISLSIQQINLKDITTEYIKKIQKQHKKTFFSRISKVKEEVCYLKARRIKIKTSISFFEEIGISI